jgi:hypothetical protein
MGEPSTTDVATGRAAIDAFYSMARTNDLDNRRFAARYPFFRPVIVSNDDNSIHQFEAFSRDISATGIGLLHNMPLELGFVTLRIENSSGVSILPATIAWCNPAGHGWYMSGAQFID